MMEKATVMETSNGSLSQKTYSSRDEDLSVCSYNRSDEAVNIGDHAVGGCTIVDEIGIFDAHKYFNESSNIEAEKVSYNRRVSPVKNVNAMNLEHNSKRFDLSAAPNRFSSASSSVDGYINARNYMARAAATPTASSEASWNSKTGLLSNPPCAIPVSMRNAQKKTSSRWLFCRKCPCTGKKSVQVQEKAHLPAPTPSLSHKHCQSSSTRAMNPKRQTPHKTRSDNMWVNTPSFFPLQMQGQHSVVRASGKPFISTDHSANNFTFPILNPSSSSSSLKARLPARHESSSISTIQSISKSFTLATIPNKSSIMIDDEVASDASSDLFEIESFSTTTTTTKHRDSQDEIVNAKGSNNYLLYSTRREEPNEIAVAPTDVEWYEASEASIDWSVTTAEGLSVAASELADDDTTIIKCNQKSSKQRSSSSSPNLNGLSLSSSCRCEKAVSVGPKPVKSLSSASNSKQRTQQQQG